MAIPLHAPRVNNNDDTVRVLRLLVQRGDAVRAGDFVAEVETEKASVAVEAEQAGVVLAVVPQVQDVVAVGSVLVWLGATIDDPVPDVASLDDPLVGTMAGTMVPTVKAAQLLERYGLSAVDVPASAGRLSARDVEAYIDGHGLVPIAAASSRSAPRGAPPVAPGTLQALTPGERGMLRTVLWQRQEAVPAYVELQYEAAAWDRVAADYQRREGLLINPLLALLAYRLTRIATANPRLTSTLVGEERWMYGAVNLGFTVQSDTTLYLAVVADAAALTCAQFIARLTTLQRQALAHRLHPSDTTGATIGFSSMARWQATRHIPVLAPQTALIVAHASPSADGRGILGATYDHRVLTGSEVLAAITALSRPEDQP
ncbi:MAG: 2-oxo acid dehydrogenase subunit E2 [Acidobacteriota bacterium]